MYMYVHCTCTCTHACMYMYIHMYTDTYTCTCTLPYTHAHTCTLYMYIYTIHTCTCKCIHMYMYVHVRTHACTCTYICTHTHTHTHMYTYTPIYSCTYTCTCTCTHKHIHVHIHHMFLFLDGDPQLLIATIDGILSSDVRGENPFYFQMSGTDRSISECHVTYMWSPILIKPLFIVGVVYNTHLDLYYIAIDTGAFLLGTQDAVENILNSRSNPSFLQLDWISRRLYWVEEVGVATG